MSQTTIIETLTGDTPVGAALTVVRNDTGMAFVNGAAMGNLGGGVWSYAVTDPAPGLVYGCTIVFTFGDGATITRIRSVAGSTDAQPRYLLSAEGLVLAASMLNVSYFLGAASATQSAALAAATADIDTAIRYQGRRVDMVAQLTEFPRVAYESNTASASYNYVGPLATNMLPGGNTVWDWDSVNQMAVIPDRVKRACILQANSRLDPVRLATLDRAASGLTSQKIGSAAETYDIAQMIAASGGSLALCREAAALMNFYRIRQGRML